MITLNSISLFRKGKILLENTSVIIHLGQHVGLVGANGAGKSSLLALLTGELQQDTGEVVIDSGRGISHMSQEVLALNRKAIDYVLDGDLEFRRIENAMVQAEQKQEHDKIAGLHDEYLVVDGYTARPRAEQLLVGLGFCHDDIERNVRDFSGGWRMRLNLAKTLMCPADVLLLDEPTNHLDLDAIVWLEGCLKKFQGTLLVISHDRDFLDAVTDTTLHIEQKALNKYRGGYSAFERLRSEHLAQQQVSFEKQQQEKAHMESFVERFRAKATKARQAQSRLKALERLEEIAPAPVDTLFSFRFPESDKISYPLLTLDQACLGYDQHSLLKVNMSIQPGSRIALLGSNGAGKSTLVKSLAGGLALISGQRQPGAHLRIGYFAQHQLESLDEDASALIHLQRLASSAREQELRNFLGGFGFVGDKAFEEVEGFSGGEKARLALAIIAWGKPNILLLDEPTNHLDLDMRSALTVALQSFSGAMILVSHDRSLIRSTTNELLLVNNGCVEPFIGSIDDYSEWLLRQKDEENDSKTKDKNVSKNSAKIKKEQKRLEADKRQMQRPLKKKIEDVEHKIDENQGLLSEIEVMLGDTSVYDEHNKSNLKELLAKQAVLKKVLSEAEDKWVDLQEMLEELNNQT
ncbi:MAG: ATP-binding cassette domain-containing protein [Candidatus Endonucleobacter bathymodioli]|uniref:Probable ATP-binding protein YheS n=1 Tax=Candidatus Endonucleibacter bathymodioli TaxID=539814 RepID=A0AA90NUT8_9GAMM|nr:ATP-binding cassette domain-containing protein [Candidatus Endonucleobacter bathymodioli]